MPAPTTDQATNPWDVINDFSKTTVTLGSALLALTVTFSEKLLAREGGALETGLLFGTWVFLVAAIAAGLIAHALVINYLRKGTSESKCIFFANAALFLLFISIVIFLIFGWVSFGKRENITVSGAIEKLENEMPKITRNTNLQWDVTSLKWMEATRSFEVTVTDRSTKDKYTVVIDAVRGRVATWTKN